MSLRSATYLPADADAPSMMRKYSLPVVTFSLSCADLFADGGPHETCEASSSHVVRT